LDYSIDMKPAITPADLREARRVRNLSQRELAEAVGVDSNSLARWEQGTRSIPKWMERMLDLMRRLDIVEHELAREVAARERLQRRAVKQGGSRKT
jgi:transcriptional regulator with XRE-family HTH domain